MDDPINWGWVVAALALVWTVLHTVYTWYASGQAATKKDVSELGTRITRIESDMRSMPTAAQFHELDKKVTEVGGAIRVMEAEMRPTAISVKRIEDYLLNKIGQAPRG